MRQLITLPLFFCVFATQAQRLSIFDLLSVASCQEKACIEDFAGSRGMCQKGGNEEDGWMWGPCDHIIGDSLLDPEHVVTLGFFGHHTSGYYRYIIGSRDTAYAAILTEQLEQLGFEKDKQLRKGHSYRSAWYPGLELERLEKHSGSLVPKRKGDPKGRFNKPLEELPEVVAAVYREQGFDSYDLIPQLFWVFKVVVRPVPKESLGSSVAEPGSTSSGLMVSPTFCPAGGAVRIDAVRAVDLRVLDASGRTIRAWIKPNFNGTTSFETSGLAPGIFVVRAVDPAGRVEFAKVVVE